MSENEPAEVLHVVSSGNERKSEVSRLAMPINITPLASCRVVSFSIIAFIDDLSTDADEPPSSPSELN